MKTPLLFLTGDARILDLIRKGDRHALVKLYATTRKMVTSYVLHNRGTPDDAEEMLQEAMVILWERVRSGQFTYSAKLSTFLYSTVKHIWLRELARTRREVSRETGMDVLPGDGATLLDELVTHEEHAGLATSMNDLGEPCRTLLLLFYWEELSLEEIARRMGFANADTVKSKKYQCKKTLQELMARAGHKHD